MIFVALRPDFVEVRDVGRVTAHQADEVFRVLLHGPGVLPGVAFRVVVGVGAQRVERLVPLTVGGLAAHEFRLGVVQVAVGAGTFRERRGLVGFAQRVGELRHAPIVVSVFHRVGNGAPLLAGGHVAMLAVFLLAVALVGGLRRLHGFQRGVGVEATETLDVRLGDDRDGMVPVHAAVFHPSVDPDGQFLVGAVLVKREQAADQVVHAFGRGQREQRMERAVGVPGGERRVIGMARRAVDFLVRRAVGTVHVAEKIRMDVGMVQCGVERLRRRLVAGAEFDARELVVPGFARGGVHAVEIPCGDFRVQVGTRAFDAHRRESRL